MKGLSTDLTPRTWHIQTRMHPQEWSLTWRMEYVSDEVCRARRHLERRRRSLARPLAPASAASGSRAVPSDRQLQFSESRPGARCSVRTLRLHLGARPAAHHLAQRDLRKRAPASAKPIPSDRARLLSDRQARTAPLTLNLNARV